MITEAVGPEIRRRREAQSRTLRQLAAVVKIDFGYLGKIERGGAASIEVYDAIAKALGIDLATLFIVRVNGRRRVRAAAAGEP
jgi:transcriptional regulator with XRE-family HTH domain